MSERVQGVEIQGPRGVRFEEILTPDALGFVARLHREFDATRRELLAARMQRQEELDAGGTLDFLSDTEAVRAGDWTIAPGPTRPAQPTRGDHRSDRAARWSSTR